MKKTDPPRLPAEMTLAEAAIALGVHRSNAYRKFKAVSKWGTHTKRRVRVVSTRLVLQAIAEERNRGPALPEIDAVNQKISALLKIQERQAVWIARAAQKLGIAV